MRKLLPLVAVLITAIPASAQDDGTILDEVQALDPLEMDELLWMARGVYSESDRANEQELVAWVIRNRVETGFRGDSYRQVVLERKQFSAFNEPSKRRTYILGLDQTDVVPSWMRALEVSMKVFQASPTERPFAIDTRHFYSPVSMVGRSEPVWAKAGVPISSVSLGVDPDRFRFFSGIDKSQDMVAATVNPTTFAEGASVEERIDQQKSASEKIDEQRIEQQQRAADRAKTLRRSTRVRRFSGRVQRPSRPKRGTGG
ncbi:MAG: cell wall hydrolase [Rhodothermales bacterium]|nr:cell wall hydrolase [Rhodothermales bacterium]MBO6780708.1 cell wall hydrolase [Rhodothermales bacterium]